MWLDQLYIVGEVALAAALGAIVGIEREMANKPAGLKTHMLVAAAAAMFVALGDVMTENFRIMHPEAQIGADPVRIIQAIVVGISFLGAGTILQVQSERRVEGLTTSASVLFTSGIGIAVAAGQVVLAASAALLVFAINWGIGHIADRLGLSTQDEEREPPSDEPQRPTRRRGAPSGSG